MKILFLLVAIAGIVAVFYASWFWRALIAPMVLILLWDVMSSLFRKKG